MKKQIICILANLFALALLAISSNSVAANPNKLCGASFDVSEVLDTNHLLIFGEIHGTKEIPEFMSTLVCNALATKKEVVLLLEYPVSINSDIKTFINSKGTIKDKQKLVNTKVWQNSFQDGRTSLAMLEMLYDLSIYKKQTGRLVVETFADYSSINEKTNVEQAYANKAKAIYSANPHSLVVMLVGNYHGNPSFKNSMVNLLSVPFVYFELDAPEGESWSCKPECGVSKIRRNNNLTKVTTKLNFDSSKRVQQVINLGKYTASYPAKNTYKN